MVLENDKDVLKWFKPTSEDARRLFQIYYRVGTEERHYEPDFVLETRTRKYLCEVKGRDEMEDPVVLAKAEKAAEWCSHALKVAVCVLKVAC